MISHCDERTYICTTSNITIVKVMRGIAQTVTLPNSILPRGMNLDEFGKLVVSCTAAMSSNIAPNHTCITVAGLAMCLLSSVKPDLVDSVCLVQRKHSFCFM